MKKFIIYVRANYIFVIDSLLLSIYKCNKKIITIVVSNILAQNQQTILFEMQNLQKCKEDYFLCSFI